MNDRNAVVVVDDPDFDRLSIGRWPNEHRDVGIVGFEGSPVMSECVQHVVVGNTVLAGACLDVKSRTLGVVSLLVNTC